LKNRLTTLYQLQLIDDQLDMMEELRGDLPLAVNDLNGRIQDIQDQIDSKEKEKKNSLETRKSNEEEVARLKVSLKKFKSQLYQVRNNKEYDALTKEIDHSEEHIEKLEEENVEMEDLSEKLKIEIEDLSPQLVDLKKELKVKQSELKKIIKANEVEEVKLEEDRKKVAADIRKSDYNTYKRIRKALFGKAVVTINRGACSGCHNVVPSQRQIEIRQNNRLYTCESCGRLLVSKDVADDAEK
jgi:predicted  nucleic acid-binding Zn-ribbon protein